VKIRSGDGEWFTTIMSSRNPLRISISIKRFIATGYCLPPSVPLAYLFLF
jgi:hypothetical protein